MTYELEKQLKKAGFPFKKWTTELDEQIIWDEGDVSKEPTLSELIEACGEKFFGLHQIGDKKWMAFMYDIEDSSRQVEIKGETPEEAVANLWFELNKSK